MADPVEVVLLCCIFIYVCFGLVWGNVDTELDTFARRPPRFLSSLIMKRPVAVGTRVRSEPAVCCLDAGLRTLKRSYKGKLVLCDLFT